MKFYSVDSLLGKNWSKHFEEEIQMNIDIEYFLVFGYYLIEAG